LKRLYVAASAGLMRCSAAILVFEAQ
jgi:hypothetical protein